MQDNTRLSVSTTFLILCSWTLAILAELILPLDVELPVLAQQGHHEVYDSLGVSRHWDHDAGVLIDNKPVQVKDLIDSLCVILALFQHFTSHLHNRWNHTLKSMHFEVCIIEEVLHVLDTGHFEAEVGVVMLIRGEHGKYSICKKT